MVAAGAASLAIIVLAAVAPPIARAPASYVIGAKPFAEQYILASLIEQRLQAAGLAASRRDGLGSAIIFNALAAGEVDAYVDYTGTIWADLMHRSDVRPRTETSAAVKDWLAQRGIVVVGALGFENAYALAMTCERAHSLGIASMSDLARHAADLSIAADYEFFGRPEWKAMRDAYGLKFRQERQMQPEFMYRAVGREVDVIAAYTSDGRLLSHDLVLLDDPKHALPPYDAVLLVSPRRANDAALLAALHPLVGAISLQRMREANLRADSGTAPTEVARWLWQHVGARGNGPRLAVRARAPI
jgi:osmoprotectant transport system permease protein